MRRVRLTSLNDFAEWRLAARGLLLGGTRPEQVAWDDPAAAVDLFAMPEDRPEDISRRAVGVVPPGFIALAEAAICHRDPVRFGLLYRLLFRLQKDRGLLEARSDPDVSRLHRLAAEVRRDSQAMLAAIRDGDAGPRFAAWVGPQHYVLERSVPALLERFGEAPWAVLAPYRSVAWTGARLLYGRGARRGGAPRNAAGAAAWSGYFAAIFGRAWTMAAAGNPWAPQLIASLVDTSMEAAMQKPGKVVTLPEAAPAEAITSLAAARAAVQGCRRCPLYEHATQAVFGEGPPTAEVMFVGEQPGDQEDLAGKPFVGPAGQLFDRVLDTVGLERRRTYVTNAVKHFKFEPRGKRRIHQRPNAGEISACRFWLELERELVRPKLVVAMGATAVQSLTGKAASISSLRGKKLELPDGAALLVTVHPSYLLRIPEAARKAEELKKFEADLRAVWAYFDRRGDEVRQGGAAGHRAA
ncbi:MULTISPECIES: UdgX family uracil-DNA binding protein [unclassified Devosia]|uniref:UdgX family uracil-DNA binding protein n=1 Tax=unclassified Devosia TaxID=196773 RepID=UPI000A7D7A84|nr:MULTISPECIES: UdgX family uracil-DNA binding protein [unclassified Devosia]MBN9306774.1 UdgX family uracil-DNA binding protein [Devosia sp.]